jgi:WD40 repeat protein/serine/threonine protein kinase
MPIPVANPTGSSDQALGRLVDELTAKLQAGEPVDRQACLREHPEYAEQLRQLLPALEMLAGLGRSAVEAPGELLSVGPAEEMLGTLGDFRLLREIGRGGMGVVYEAVQISLSRRVALKVLPFAAAMDTKQLQRFKNEAQAAAHLQHTNIVPVHYVGCERGVHFYAMQYIEGQTLAAVIRDLRRLAGPEAFAGEPPLGLAASLASELAMGRWAPAKQPGGEGVGLCGRVESTGPYRPHHPTTSSPHDLTPPVAVLSTEPSTRSPGFFRTVAHLGMQAAEALEHAHQLGVIHRDIKPANLLVDAGGRLWVTDFGLAHCQSQPGLTMTGDLVGTLRYMSPEQALAKRVTVDARTDVYSLGATLYELLTLEPAYNGRNREEVLRQIAFEEPRPPSRGNKALPAELETIVLKAMAKNPEERYATAQELADDLRRFLEDKPIKAKRPSLQQRAAKWARRHKTMVRAAVVVLVLAMAALAVSAVLIWRANQELLRTLYYQYIALAERECATNDMNKADQLLAACPTEMRGWEWHYLRRLARSGVVALRHKNPALCVAFSRDGRRLATGTQDGTVTIWDTVTWLAVQSFAAHPHHHVRCVDFSSDGQRLATAGWDGTARVWNVESGRALYTLRDQSHGVAVDRAVFSSDGRWLATAGGDMGVTLWDAETGQLCRTLEGHRRGSFKGLTFSPDSRLLAAAVCDQKAVNVWDPSTGRLLLSLSGQDVQLHEVAFSPDGRRLAAASVRSFLSGFPGDIRIWDAATGELLQRLRGHTNVVFSLAFSPDGRRLASASEDMRVKLWDVSTGKETLTLHGHQGCVMWVAFSPDGNRLASASDDGTVRVWDATPLGGTSAEEPFTLRGDSQGVHDVAFGPDGDRLATANEDHTVRIWDAMTGKELRVLDGFADSVRGIAFSPDGRWLAAVCYNSDLVVCDLRGGQPPHLIPNAGNCSVAFSPDGRHIATAGMGPDKNYPVKVWDTITQQQCLSLPGHSWLVHKLAFSPDGRHLASASFDWTVKIWDVTPGQEFRSLFAWGSPPPVLTNLVSIQVALAPSVRTLRDHAGVVKAVAFSPKGKRLASASHDGTVKICKTEPNWPLELTLHDPTGGIESVAFSPDEQRLATGHRDATVKVWDLATGECQRTLHGHTHWVKALAFSTDGRRLASGSLDGTVKLWDVRSP